MVPGTASRLANDEMLAMRQYIDEGGRLLFTGKYAGLQYAQGYEFDLEHGGACDPNTAADGCQDLSDDFLQYYLGAYLYNDDAGTKANGGLYDVMGVANPFEGLSWSFGGNSANNQDHSASFIATSGILPPSTYPQFESWASSKYVRPGGPFDPHTGTYYAYSQIADVSYKRLTRTVDLTGQSNGNLSFWISRDTEPDWDFVFVEAHTVGQDDWTTLPDANGHTSQSTGPNDPDLASCPGGWRDLHPWLDHYQTFDGVGALHPDRDDRRVERGERALERLGAVVDRPVHIRRQAGRDLDRVRERLVRAGPGRVRRRHDGLHRCHDLVRGRPRRLDGDRSAAWQRPELEQLDADDRGRIPRGRNDFDAVVDLHGLRDRGHLNARRAQRGRRPRR